MTIFDDNIANINCIGVVWNPFSGTLFLKSKIPQSAAQITLYRRHIFFIRGTTPKSLGVKSNSYVNIVKQFPRHFLWAYLWSMMCHVPNFSHKVSLSTYVHHDLYSHQLFILRERKRQPSQVHIDPQLVRVRRCDPSPV